MNAEEGFFKDGDEKAFTSKDFRFTYKNSYIYAFQMRPDGEDVEIKTLAKRSCHDILIKNVSLLGSDVPVNYERTESALKIKLSEKLNSDLPVCFKIEIE